MTASSTKTKTKGSASNGTHKSAPAPAPWRQLVDRVDRVVTPKADALMRNNLFADSMAMGTRLEVQLRRRLERQSTWLIHKVNLPTAGDIRRVQAQIAAVEARIRDVAEQMDDAPRSSA